MEGRRHRLPDGSERFLVDEAMKTEKKAAATYGVAFMASLDDLLAACDAVCITSETSRHADLVERATVILEGMNFNVMGPDEVRDQLNLTKHG